MNKRQRELLELEQQAERRARYKAEKEQQIREREAKAKAEEERIAEIRLRNERACAFTLKYIPTLPDNLLVIDDYGMPLWLTMENDRCRGTTPFSCDLPVTKDFQPIVVGKRYKTNGEIAVITGMELLPCHRYWLIKYRLIEDPSFEFSTAYPDIFSLPF